MGSDNSSINLFFEHGILEEGLVAFCDTEWQLFPTRDGCLQHCNTLHRNCKILSGVVSLYVESASAFRHSWDSGGHARYVESVGLPVLDLD